jgi:predicted DNA binding CopG/RHH family protein
LEERLNIRVSKDFKDQVKKQAAGKGFSTVTQYIKFLVANDKEKK